MTAAILSKHSWFQTESRVCVRKKVGSSGRTVLQNWKQFDIILCSMRYIYIYINNYSLIHVFYLLIKKLLFTSFLFVNKKVIFYWHIFYLLNFNITYLISNIISRRANTRSTLIYLVYHVLKAQVILTSQAPRHWQLHLF